MEFKFCPECGKPVQPALLSTKRQACASCGWTGEVIEQESVILKKQELKPRITLPKKKLIYIGKLYCEQCLLNSVMKIEEYINLAKSEKEL
jgi:ribosomal protein S27AE